LCKNNSDEVAFSTYKYINKKAAMEAAL